MNDRFNFRFWDNKIKKYREDINIASNGKPFIIPMDSETFLKPKYIDDVVVEQCTGLKDRTGQLMYEGDIVIDRVDEEIGIINWDEEDAKFVVDFENTLYGFENYFMLEVRGNIHENPELMEEVK